MVKSRRHCSYIFAKEQVSKSYRANIQLTIGTQMGSIFNVFASDCEITATDAEAGPSLRTPLMQKIQQFIMTFMELQTGRNAIEIDFWTNPIAQSQEWDYKARTLHAPEVTRHAEELSHQILNNVANIRIDRYVQNLLFQILMLYNLTILSIQNILERNKKETLINLVGMCAELLRFAEKSTYIWIRMMEGAQGAKQFDLGYNGVMSHAIQPLHALRQIQGQRCQDIANPQVCQYSATSMEQGQQIPYLVTFIPIQIIQQFYSRQLIPRPLIQQLFQGFCMYPKNQQFQGFKQPGLFKQALSPPRYSIQLFQQSSINEGLHQFMLNAQ
ncbi:MAG: hypothetical protein EZS28_032034 [Streblomastix strix]|uniref:Uncharacterized protein n=1 Tax=Streblomastix strix TaxID=222440 RepID=A0A5J4UPP3_9EUKA|nr:MAG: hypothetical protein EZS28_032034 [Streblomastix strix]